MNYSVMAIRTFKQLASRYIKSKTQKICHVTITGCIMPYDPASPIDYTNYDRICENKLDDNYEVWFCGQNKGGSDPHLEKCIRNFNNNNG